jgi:hypothetical protein
LIVLHGAHPRLTLSTLTLAFMGGGQRLPQREVGLDSLEMLKNPLDLRGARRARESIQELDE